MNRAEFGVVGISLVQKRRLMRFGATLLAALVMATAQAVAPAQAATEKALYLYYTHTKETARIVFKRDGKFVQSGLNELNYFLRDWRRNEPTKMDPALFDLIWEVYQEVGATQPINIVSAYRSPATNEMLRSKPGSGVAENSQHTKGHAMDFFIPGIPLTKLRATAMKLQVGGVGYYPTSGSPFVHLDTGSVRAWPRMTRAQLKQIFPDGKTLHLPTDGKPLSQQGYQLAMAEWKQCHTVPCGNIASGTRVASSSGGGTTLMDVLFGGDKSGGASAPAPQPTMQTASLAPQPATPQAAPIPLVRPADLGGAAQLAEVTPASLPFSTTGSAPLDAAELAPEQVAPVPAVKSERIRLATAGNLRQDDAVTAIAALAAPVPQPRLIMSGQSDETLSAYLPTAAQEPGAQKALEMIINRSATATATATPAPAPQGIGLPPLPALGASGLKTAALGPAPTGTLADLFSSTFEASRPTQPASLQAALDQHVAVRTGAMRHPELVAPDLEHVSEVFTAPDAMTSGYFAAIYDHDEADFDPTPEMGRYVIRMSAGQDTTGLEHARFVVRAPLAVASN